MLPTRLLVPLLEAARRNSGVATALQPVLGARGRWLAALNNDWLRGRAVAEPKAADWDEGTIAERVAWLRHVRQSDPDAGRRLVEEAGKEKAADRAQFVEALEIGLGAGDEAFLETLLNGRSKEVARAAARLLVRLNGSAYQRRALDLARSCLTLTKTPASGLSAKLRGKSTRTITAIAPPALMIGIIATRESTIGIFMHQPQLDIIVDKIYFGVAPVPVCPIILHAGSKCNLDPHL